MHLRLGNGGEKTTSKKSISLESVLKEEEYIIRLKIYFSVRFRIMVIFCKFKVSCLECFDRRELILDFRGFALFLLQFFSFELFLRQTRTCCLKSFECHLVEYSDLEKVSLTSIDVPGDLCASHSINLCFHCFLANCQTLILHSLIWFDSMVCFGYSIGGCDETRNI